MLKFQLCITGINYILKINILIILIFHNTTTKLFDLICHLRLNNIFFCLQKKKHFAGIYFKGIIKPKINNMVNSITIFLSEYREIYHMLGKLRECFFMPPHFKYLGNFSAPSPN